MYLRSKNLNNLCVPVRETRGSTKFVLKTMTKCNHKYLSSPFYKGKVIWGKRRNRKKGSLRLAGDLGVDVSLSCLFLMFKSAKPLLIFVWSLCMYYKGFFSDFRSKKITYILLLKEYDSYLS